MTLAATRTHTDAVLAALEATTVLVGDADPKPPGYGWQGTPGQSVFVPYMVLYPIPGGTFDGSIGDPNDDAQLLYQVTCVGSTRTQCEWVLDKALGALVGQSPVIAGRSLMRSIESDMAGGGVRRDDTVQPAVFISTPRFRLWTTPA